MEVGYVVELSGLVEVQRRVEEMVGEVDWEEEDDFEDGEGEFL